MDIKFYTEAILPTVTILFTAAGGFATIFVFFRNSQLKRSEWLFSLFEKFFYESKYAEIRRIIDYSNPDELKKLLDDISSSENHDLEEKLVDYLNFFEFIANLWLLKQVPIIEISMMFDYYIRRLDDHDFIKKYIDKNGFEGVAKLVQKVKYGS